MGIIVGFPGVTEGLSDGSADGHDVEGTKDGLSDAETDGALVAGIEVGLPRSTVGLFVGFTVGELAGVPVGPRVDTSVGAGASEVTSMMPTNSIRVTPSTSSFVIPCRNGDSK